MWTLAYGYHEDRSPTHGYEADRGLAAPPSNIIDFAPNSFTAGDQGVHVFSVALKTAGNHTITATAGVPALTGSLGVVVQSATADHLALTVPPGATAGIPVDVTLAAVDPFNNPDPTFTGTVHFTLGDAAGTAPANALP